MKLETIINQCQVGIMTPSIEMDSKMFALKTQISENENLRLS
jgi:hypothetical protein